MLEQKKTADKNNDILSRVINETVDVAISERMDSIMKNVYSKIARTERLVETAANGVGMCVKSSEIAAKAAEELLRIENEPEEEKKKYAKVIKYDEEGRVVSVTCGDNTVNVRWTGEKAISIY